MAAGPEEAMDVEGVAPVSCHSGNGAIVDIPVEKNLFGGAITCSFPLRFHVRCHPICHPQRFLMAL
jgi:hypothetical protein